MRDLVEWKADQNSENEGVKVSANGLLRCSGWPLCFEGVLLQASVVAVLQKSKAGTVPRVTPGTGGAQIAIRHRTPALTF